MQFLAKKHDILRRNEHEPKYIYNSVSMAINENMNDLYDIFGHKILAFDMTITSRSHLITLSTL